MPTSRPRSAPSWAKAATPSPRPGPSSTRCSAASSRPDAAGTRLPVAALQKPCSRGMTGERTAGLQMAISDGDGPSGGPPEEVHQGEGRTMGESAVAAAQVSDLPTPGQHHTGNLWTLTLGAVGVVYGDIGTSPLYAMRESLHAAS